MLEKILAAKRKRLSAQKEILPLGVLKNRVSLSPSTRNFRQALLGEELSIIAEIKKASPSVGDIAPGIDIRKTAKAYEEAGASAISVLTEEDYFKGSPLFVKEIKEVVSIPILRKDFILEEYQIYESRYLGADAVLLIAAVLDGRMIKNLTDLCLRLKMEPLVEVHSEEDLAKSLQTNAKVIGINNRNLETFETDLAVTGRLIGKIGPEKVIISESGISSKEDVNKLQALGVDAILVGESLIKSDNIKKKLQELLKEA